MSLMSLKNITYAPINEQGLPTTILENVNLEINKQEIVALLGRSGSGKSTLLRIVAGLIQPTSGEIVYGDNTIQQEGNNIAMVFQTFALFPWLTVSQNIELVLKAKKLPDDEVQKRTQRMIEIIGLQGYEAVYPKELSGGMRQRVGFARALAVHPKILLLDEPFSALDIITAQTLRTDFLDLWNDSQVPIDSVILVTHSIEEAVILADKIKIFASHPGHIIAEIEVSLPHPRDRLDPKFIDLVEEIYGVMTTKLSENYNSNKAQLMPKANISSIVNFLDFISSPPYNGTANLPELSSGLGLEIDDLFPIIDSLQLLKFADIKEEIIKITSAGKLLATSDQRTKKNIFAEHLIQYIPLAAQIRRTIQNQPKKKIRQKELLIELEKTLYKDDAVQVLKAIISWGRFAEIFTYNDLNKTLYIK